MSYNDLMHVLVRAGYEPASTECHVSDDVDEHGHRWNSNHPIFVQRSHWVCKYNPTLPHIVLSHQTCNGIVDRHAHGTLFTGKAPHWHYGFDVRGNKEYAFETRTELLARMAEHGIPEYRDVHYRAPVKRSRRKVAA